MKETNDADELAEQMAKKLAMVKIVHERYGGSEREIYEKSIPDLKNEEFVVSEVNFVKTGTRIPGYQSSSIYHDDCDYEPTTFDVDKTYKILTLQYKDSDQKLRLEYLNLKDEDLRIQANNVKKLASSTSSFLFKSKSKKKFFS